MYCQKCGVAAVEGDAFCNACGTPFVAPAATPPATRTTGTGIIVALVLVVILAISGLGVGGYFLWRAANKGEDPPLANVSTTPAPVETPAETPVDTAAPPAGFATAEEALADHLPQGWVSDTLSDKGDTVEFAMGPPASEYSDVVVIARQPDGTWLIKDSRPIVASADTEPSASNVDQATDLVESFITSVMEDRADDAHALTISPFAEDPASASFSNGDLGGFSIADAQLQGDGTTVLVTAEEQWLGGAERYVYTCVPTADGYRISELRPE